MKGLVHCHAHNHNSTLDGSGTERQYAAKAAELGQGALAETNHGTLAGSIRHMQACRDFGIVPLIGVEAYFRPNRLLRDPKIKAHHQILIAKNIRGWHNLIKLTSIAYDDQRRGGGFYGKPCIDWEIAEKYSEGLICTTACIGSYLSSFIAQGDEDGARDVLRKLKDIYRDDLFLEIQPHDIDLQREDNIARVRLAREEGIPLVAGGDVHFLQEGWHDTHEVLKLKSTASSFKKREEQLRKKAEGKSRLDDTADTAAAERRRQGEDVFTKPLPTAYLMSREEMAENFRTHHPHLDEAIIEESLDNTHELASRCVPFVIDKRPKMPRVTKTVDEAEKILRDWIDEGLEQRLAYMFSDPNGRANYEPLENIEREYRERIEFELDVMRQRRVFGYFVLCGRLVRWLQTDEPLPPTPEDPNPPRKKPVPIGSGRGSAAGSLVAYLIGLTKVDPIPYGLLFERFLNPDRKGLPDIDQDMSGRGKALVREWINRTEGYEYGAAVSNWNRFTPKAALNEVGSVFDIRNVTEKLNKTYDIKPTSTERTLEEVHSVNPEVRKFAKDYPDVWKHALRLEGSRSGMSKNASALVVADRPITDVAPLQAPKQPVGWKWGVDPPLDLVTAWDMHGVEEVGLIKFDFLGIDVLDRQEYAVDLIRAKGRYEENEELANLDLDALPCMRDPYAVDPEVMEVFCKGETESVFQFSSAGMKDLLRRIKPTSVFDLAAANALYRPGPMGSGNDYAKRKHNKYLREYWAPQLESVLGRSYGLMIYQEDLMRIVQVLGDFTRGQADDMRKAISKLYRSGKAQEYMQKHYWNQWVTGTSNHGVADDVRDLIWGKFLDMGDYAFNLSHAVVYCLLSYRDAWLKVKHGVEFYAAVLTKEADESIRMNIVREARDKGVPILPPRIGISEHGFVTSSDGIHFGYRGVKGIGEKASEKIMSCYGYGDIDDFKENSGLAKNVIEALEECGALDNLGGRRDWDETTKQRLERQRLGISLSAPPVHERWAHIIDPQIVSHEEYAQAPASSRWAKNGKRAQLTIGGEITSLEEFKVKKAGPNKGKPMARFQISYRDDTYNCIMFPDKHEKFGELLTAGVPAVLIHGVKDSDDEDATLIVDEMADVVAVERVLGKAA